MTWQHLWKDLEELWEMEMPTSTHLPVYECPWAAQLWKDLWNTPVALNICTQAVTRWVTALAVARWVTALAVAPATATQDGHQNFPVILCFFYHQAVKNFTWRNEQTSTAQNIELRLKNLKHEPTFRSLVFTESSPGEDIEKERTLHKSLTHSSEEE